MKKTVILIALGALMLAGCGQRVKFDEAAVEVREAGSSAGVQESEVSTGRYWNHPFSYRYIVKFPVTQQTYKWNGSFKFINADRVETGQQIAMNVQIRPQDADNLVRKYKGAISKGGGEDGYVLDDIIYGPVMQDLQQAFVVVGPKYTSAQLYADGGQSLLKDVRAIVGPKYERDGIVINGILSAGPPILPADIVSRIKASLLAVENAKTKDAELAATIAEGKKTIAQAQANGEARRITAESIRANPEVIKLEEIQRRGASMCPVGVTTCIIGASAIHTTQ